MGKGKRLSSGDNGLPLGEEIMKRKKTHPGEILLEEFMKPSGLSANALSIALHIDANRIGEIIKGKRSVTANTALRLSSFFSTTPQFWMNLQTNYDLSKEELKDLTKDIKPFAAVN